MASKVFPIAIASRVAAGSLAPARKVLVSGDERATSLALKVTARAACQGKRVLFICGDNRFDPYAVSRLARSMGARAEDALRSILIARAFTAYQLSELVGRLTPDPSRDVVVISGPCSMFFDEDVPACSRSELPSLSAARWARKSSS